MRINVNKTLSLRIGNRFNCKISDNIIDGNVISCSQEMKYLAFVFYRVGCLNVTLIMLR